MDTRLRILGLLLIASAVLSTLGALGMPWVHYVFKPATMLVAIVLVAARAHSTGSTTRFDYYLMAALLFSLAGDVFLMLPIDAFIPGLGSFLVAHLFYIVLFRQGQAWFPSRVALAGTLGVGALMYAIVWSGLGDPVLKVAVAAYVTVIALMAAQAIGRATVQGGAAARWVAVGACVFMVSDSLIAINKFVMPVPLSALWILSTYYVAQILIVHHARRD